MKGDGLRPRSRFSGHPFSRCDFRHRRNIYRTFYGHGTDAAQRHELRAALSYYAGGKPIATVYRTCEVAPTLGVKDIEDANGTNAAYSANPTNLAHFVVTVAPLNQSTAPVINLNVEIRYWVKFYSLNDVVDS